ncbi:MAG: DUF3883 domain-containing protein [Deltaproteobacteria bacterium]|nr:DUF3883 domain-containing protein [Deltaproteobacteria bacterium]MBW2046585.1 DUF3883 domain-containing protein [Deltaproteobacteria bacterium]
MAKTEQKGIDAVIEYERQNGRAEIQRVHNKGYDLITRGNGEERHIEVKATGKDKFYSRWLEEKEYQALRSDPHFYLYLVTNANREAPKVWPYDREKAFKRFKGETKKFLFNFPKEDFEDNVQKPCLEPAWKHKRMEFSITSELNIVSYKKSTREFFPKPHHRFTLVIGGKEYETSIRYLKRSGATSFAKTYENGVRVSRSTLCKRHNLGCGGKVLVEMLLRDKKYRLIKQPS